MTGAAVIHVNVFRGCYIGYDVTRKTIKICGVKTVMLRYVTDSWIILSKATVRY
jgi:hypothetical protein